MPCLFMAALLVRLHVTNLESDLHKSSSMYTHIISDNYFHYQHHDKRYDKCVNCCFPYHSIVTKPSI